MNKTWNLTLSLLLLACCTPALAGDDASDSAYAELLSLIQPFTYELKKPVTVYNWHPAASNAELLSSSQAPQAYSGVQQIAARYWEKQTDPNVTGTYGTGLYAAIDPVITKSFGGGNADWILTQMVLPAGFRIMDLMRDGGFVLPIEKDDLITRLGCPDAWKDQPLLNNLMNPTKYKGYPKCASVARKLFKDDLKIDGFAYGYSATNFGDCDQIVTDSDDDDDARPAFVIVNGDKLSPSRVRVLNRLTQDDYEDRLRIQELFAKAQKADNSTNASGPTATQLKAVLQSLGLPQYMTWADNAVNSSTVTVGTDLFVTSTICNVSPMNVTLGNAGSPLPQASPMQCVAVTTKNTANIQSNAAADPATLNKSDFKPGSFLWDNLEGKPVPQNLSAWMKKNIYGCESVRAYKSAQGAVSGHPSTVNHGSGDGDAPEVPNATSAQ